MERIHKTLRREGDKPHTLIENDTAVLCLWNRCNNNCIMCTNPDGGWLYEDYSYRAIIERLLSIRGKVREILLTGGEPTIHKDWAQLLEFLKSEMSNIKITLVTNGRRFFYPSFALRCLEIKNLNIMIALHGYDAATHDIITAVKGSFIQTLTGIENLLKLKSPYQTLELRLIVTGLSCGYIDKMLSLIKRRFADVDRVVVIFMEIEGKAEKNLKECGITYRDFQRFLPAISKWVDKFKTFHFYHFPLCAIDTKLWPYVARTLPPEEVEFTQRCSNCWAKAYCLGIHKGYLKHIGNREFSPPPRVAVKETGDFYHPIEKCL